MARKKEKIHSTTLIYRRHLGFNLQPQNQVLVVFRVVFAYVAQWVHMSESTSPSFASLYISPFTTSRPLFASSPVRRNLPSRPSSKQTELMKSPPRRGWLVER
jgi:hypothetical protein